MYIYEDMVDMGLPNGVSWPTEAHRIVAQNILLNNSQIDDLDKLKQGVINVLNIPTTKIKTIKMEELSKYGFDIKIGINKCESKATL